MTDATGKLVHKHILSSLSLDKPKHAHDYMYTQFPTAAPYLVSQTPVPQQQPKALPQLK